MSIYSLYLEGLAGNDVSAQLGNSCDLDLWAYALLMLITSKIKLDYRLDQMSPLFLASSNISRKQS